MRASRAAGLGHLVDVELAGLDDPVARDIRAWAVLEQDGEARLGDSAVAPIARAALAAGQGKWKRVLAAVEGADDPQSWRYRIRAHARLGDRRGFARAAAELARALPDRHDLGGELFREQMPRGPGKKALKRALRRIDDPNASTAELLRVKFLLDAAKAFDAIERIAPVLADRGQSVMPRRAWSTGMRRAVGKSSAHRGRTEVPPGSAIERLAVAKAMARFHERAGDPDKAVAVWQDLRRDADSSEAALRHAHLLEGAEAAEAASTAQYLAVRPRPDDVACLDRAWIGAALTAAGELGAASQDPLVLASLPDGSWAERARLLAEAEYDEAAFAAAAIGSATEAVDAAALWTGFGPAAPAIAATRSVWEAEITDWPELLPPPVTEAPVQGKPMVPWSARTDAGERSRSNTEGDVVLLTLWASWCRPCLTELPALDAIAGRLAADGLDVHIVAVGVDEEERDYRKLRPTKQWPHLDVGYRPSLQRRLAATTLPISWIIDRDGTVVSKRRGYVDGDAADIEEQLRSLARKR